MFAVARDKISTTLKKYTSFAKYKYYYPVLNWVYYKQHLAQASQLFEKSQQMREKKEVKIPFFTNEKHNKVFQDFCMSGINDFGFENNKTSMCIVLGPSGIGKTTFIRSNLSKLVSNPKNIKYSDPDWFNVTSFNCSSFGILNFDTFINNLENVLINSCHKQFSKIVKQSDLYFKNQDQLNEIQFDAVKTIQDILYNSYANEFLNLYGRDMISALLNDEEIGMVVDDEIKPILSELYNLKMLEEGRDLSEVFNEIVEILKSCYAGDSVRAAIQFSVSLLARIEYENRPPLLKDTYYRDGIIVNTFLFDLLNYIEGYHQINKTGIQFAQNIVVFENFDHIFQGYQNDIRFYNFQDHLLLRLYSNNRERDHFPVVIETSNSRFFAKELFEMMHISFITYGYIENYGIPSEMLNSHYSSIFSNREIELLKRKIGTNTSSWTKLLESITLKPKQSNSSSFLSNLTKNKQNNLKQQQQQQNINNNNNSTQNNSNNKQKITFEDLVNLKTEYFEKEYIKFKGQIASVYLDNTVAQLLDGVDVQDRDYHNEKKKQKDPAENDEIIKYYILDTFEALIYNYGTVQMSSAYAQSRLLENPVVKALLSANILYLRYYYSYLMFDKFIFNSFAKRYIQEVKSQMTLSQKFQYYKWQKKNGIEKISLILFEDRTFTLQSSPQNTRDFQMFKLNPELPYHKGIDFEQVTPSVTEEIISRIAKK